MTTHLKRLLRRASRRIGALALGSLTVVFVAAIAALILGLPAVAVIVVALTSAVVILGLAGVAVLAVLLRRRLKQVDELATVVRSMDSHIGAVRRQLRVAIEQELSLQESKRTRRVRGRDIRRLRSRIWAGFEAESVAALEEYQFARGIDRRSRAAASVVLAAWRYVYQTPHDAYRAIAMTRTNPASAERELEHEALEADALIDMGRLDEARRVVDSAIEAFGRLPELCFRKATADDPTDISHDDRRLHLLNLVLADFGVGAIVRRDASAPLTLANLATEKNESIPTGTHTPLISVIMPMRNSEDTIRYALQSVLDQSWTNLQVVIVDDGSDDSTLEIVHEYAYRDSRIEIYVRDAQGAYAARNFGLSQCRGQFVTVHDADDWSHPEKLERQVTAIIESDRRASWSYWIRCSHDLAFCAPSLRMQYRHIVRNYSSLMFERSVFDDLGTWDEATVSSDGEFIERLQAFDGPGASLEVLPEVPLSFGLRTEQSLTASGATGILSIHHITGARRQYREAYRAWHSSATFRSSLPLDLRSGTPFARPRLMDPDRRERDEPCDLVVVADFSDAGGRGTYLESLLVSLAERDSRTGILHLPGRGRDDAPRSEILRLLDNHLLRVVSSGENIDARLVIVDDASLLDSPLANAPRLTSTAKPLVVVRRRALGLDPTRVAASLDAFGLTSTEWRAANPTLLAELHGLVASLNGDHSAGSVLWREEAVSPSGEHLPLAQPVARVRTAGFRPAANNRLIERVEASASLCMFDAEPGPTAQSDETPGDEMMSLLDRRTHDVLVLGADEPVDQDVLLEALGSAAVIFADGTWADLLGDIAIYDHVNDDIEAIETFLRDQASWRSQLIRAQAEVDRRFGADAAATTVLDTLTD